ncbi:MAG: hypothetical protein M1834_008925 [Cirrosporium novae-zelandiae]|nr:MAG: hypothetical protein M1834_008925 [Cirrosporium novae-zelandiae]
MSAYRRQLIFDHNSAKPSRQLTRRQSVSTKAIHGFYFDFEVESTKPKTVQENKATETEDEAPKAQGVIVGEDFDGSVISGLPIEGPMKEDSVTTITDRDEDVDEPPPNIESQERSEGAVGEPWPIRAVNELGLDDERIKRQVMSLRSRIKAWAGHTFRAAEPNGHKFRRDKFSHSLYHQPSSLDILSLVTPEYLRLARKEKIVTLAQAFVWKCLVDSVFGQSIWAGTPCTESWRAKYCPSHKAFRAFQSSLRPLPDASNEEKERFNEWQSLTARLLGKKTLEHHSKCINHGICRITDQIAGYLKPFCEDKKKFHVQCVGNNSADDSLQRIIASAVKLDALLAKQKAFFAFFPVFQYQQVPILMYDSQIMKGSFDMRRVKKAKAAGRQIVVDLVAEPGLLKRGNSEGKQLEEQSVTLKATVFGPRDREKSDFVRDWALCSHDCIR